MYYWMVNSTILLDIYYIFVALCSDRVQLPLSLHWKKDQLTLIILQDL